MRQFLTLVLLAAGVITSAAHGSVATAPRVLVISAPNLDHATYRAQAALLLPAWRGLLERDFLVETRFDTAAFSVVLIGKDGGEKLRRTTPLAPDELFAVVDAMPMRRAEVRDREPGKR